MPAAELVRIVKRGEAPERVLLNRVEHQEAVVADRLQQARVDERRESIEVGVADLVDGGTRRGLAADSARPLHEQPGSIACRERLDAKLLLARDVKRRTARH